MTIRGRSRRATRDADIRESGRLTRRRAPGGSARLGDLTPAVDERPDGTVVLRAMQPLEDYPAVLTERLAHWARVAPERTLLGWRRRRWVSAIHGRVRAPDLRRRTPKSRCLGQALLDRRLSADRPLAILSGNGVSTCCWRSRRSTSAFRSRRSRRPIRSYPRDFGALEHVIALLSPGLVFVSDLGEFGERSTRPWARRRSRRTPIRSSAAVARAGRRDVRSLLATRPTPRSLGGTRLLLPTTSRRSSSRRAQQARRKASSIRIACSAAISR